MTSARSSSTELDSPRRAPPAESLRRARRISNSSSNSFQHGHVASPPLWTHFDQGLGEFVNAIRALLDIGEGWHRLQTGLSVKTSVSYRQVDAEAMTKFLRSGDR